MRKSNVIILAVLAVAAGFFLWLWYYLGFNFVDDPFDLVLAVVWWAVVVALVVGIHAAERKRQRRVRTAYLAPGVLFNSEAGFVDLAAFEEGTTLVDALEHTLADLKYSFDRKDPADEGTAAPDGAVPSAAMAGGLCQAPRHREVRAHRAHGQVRQGRRRQMGGRGRGREDAGSHALQGQGRTLRPSRGIAPPASLPAKCKKAGAPSNEGAPAVRTEEALR